ncbi:MAG: Gfo/Idh/MocA family oxidoreductase [Lentisphaeria bacterium]|nr:Gfo/Idh/MocA family oxidoreductase [Lentisphaeria bacterium]
MSGKMRVGIIGAGTIGSVHADAYKKVADADLVALCDILPDRLKEKAERHDIALTYENYKDLLANPDIDCISVCVPNNMHAPIAIDALKAGKNVMLEKPMAMNPAEGEAICAARDISGKTLQMGMVRRQSPDAEVVRELIQSGKLGDIYQIRIRLIRRRGIPGMGGWFTTKAESGGGGLIDIGVHFFDLAMWATDLWNPTRVSAKTYAKFGSPMEDYNYIGMWAGPPDYEGTFDVDDYAAGFVRFGTQATMSFEVAWAANATDEQMLEILGTKGGVKVGGDTILLTEVDGRLADIKLNFDKKADGFVKELTKFVAASKGEGEVPATGEQGVVAMKLIDAIFRSSELDQEVTID